MTKGYEEIPTTEDYKGILSLTPVKPEKRWRGQTMHAFEFVLGTSTMHYHNVVAAF